MKKLGLLLSLVALTQILPAQGMTQFDGSQRGRGVVRRDGVSDAEINQVRIMLEKGGKFTVTTYGKLGTTFTGDWKWADGGAVLDIEQAFGDRDARGSGKVMIAGGRFETLSMSGRVTEMMNGRANDANFSLTFTDSRNPGDALNVNDPDTRNTYYLTGTGTWWDSGARQTIREMTFRYTNAGFEASSTNNSRFRITGSVTPLRNSNDYVLTVATYDGRDVKGSGRLDLDTNGRMEKISLNGTDPADRFTLSFDIKSISGGTVGNNNVGSTQWGGGRNINSYNEIVNGKGKWTAPNRSRNLTKLDINLRRDGSFVLSPTSGADFTVTGTWRVANSGNLELNVERINNAPAEGNGWVTRNDWRLNRFHMDATANRKSFALDFTIQNAR